MYITAKWTALGCSPLATFSTSGLVSYFRPNCVIKHQKAGCKIFLGCGLGSQKNSKLILEGHTPQEWPSSLLQIGTSCWSLDGRFLSPQILSETRPHRTHLVYCALGRNNYFYEALFMSSLPEGHPNNVSLAIKGFIRHTASPVVSFRGKEKDSSWSLPPPVAICCPFQGHVKWLAPEKRAVFFF